MPQEKYSISRKKFISAGSESSYITLPLSGQSADWDKKQENAIDEYVDEIAHADPGIDDVYKLFEDYIARSIFGRTNQMILDVGCGIDPDYPKYAKLFEAEMDQSGNTYIGIDPISYHDDKRKYPFICGRIEDVPEKLDTKFNVFLFSTCLDHFENIGDVAASVRKIAAPGAICLVWIGLHDTSVVAEQAGAQMMPQLYSNLNPVSFFIKYTGVCLKLMANLFYFRKRERKLSQKIPLDNLHFHYFTKESILQYLQHFGNIVDERKVPGTNGMFYTVTLK